MIVSLDDAKTFLRVDFTDDDVLIQTLIDAATDYLTAATGIVFDSTSQRERNIVFLLVTESYSNREIGRQIDAGGSNLINTMITQLSMSTTSNVVQVPTGLTATLETNYVLLRWLANIEPNVDGYNLYRNGVKLNADGLIREQNYWVEWPLAWGDWPYPRWFSQQHPSPGVMAFNDSTILQGQTYAYQVSAVDTLGNETSLSIAVSVTT